MSDEINDKIRRMFCTVNPDKMTHTSHGNYSEAYGFYLETQVTALREALTAAGKLIELQNEERNLIIQKKDHHGVTRRTNEAFEVYLAAMKKGESEMITKPVGLTPRDTLEDALARADRMSDGSNHFSGMLLERTDLRRIVLLAWEYRKLKQIADQLKRRCEAAEKLIEIIKDRDGENKYVTLINSCDKYIEWQRAIKDMEDEE